MISRPITFTTTRKLKLGAIGLLISRKVGLCGKKINDDVRADISIAMFVAKYKYTKLQDQNGQCCMSKKDKVASLTPE